MTLQERLDIEKQLKDILLESGKDLLEASGTEWKTLDKGDRDFALEMDIRIEEKISSFLQQRFPGIPVMGEELSPENRAVKQSEFYWVIDPIDGTVNYSRKIPQYGSCIALVQNGQSVVSGMNFPALNELYSASKGGGARLNGNLIKVTEVDEMNKAMISYGDFAVGEGSLKRNEFRHDLLGLLINDVLRVRIPGSAALQLAWTASGLTDLSLTLSNKPWDVQAGVLLVREAGGLVYDYDGSPHTDQSDYTVACNSRLKEQVLKRFSHL